MPQVAAAQRSVITSGRARITIENADVEMRCPGKPTAKAAPHSFEEPASLDNPLPTMSQGESTINNVYNPSRQFR
ncbi:DUF2345 domain-containing protein [Paraburkholderia sediminicola]|uniref:DUF2345 domain-containing protein n=1 Tax=Paraburkholderia sediminicola TaxID=458836 RepID=UPI0038B97624